jgi:hypothetical protein
VLILLPRIAVGDRVGPHLHPVGRDVDGHEAVADCDQGAAVRVSDVIRPWFIVELNERAIITDTVQVSLAHLRRVRSGSVIVVPIIVGDFVLQRVLDASEIPGIRSTSYKGTRLVRRESPRLALDIPGTGGRGEVCDNPPETLNPGGVVDLRRDATGSRIEATGALHSRSAAEKFCPIEIEQVATLMPRGTSARGCTHNG